MKTRSLMLAVVIVPLMALPSLAVEPVQEHTHTNFTLSLPTSFKRQPQKGYSDSFLFKNRTAFLSFQCVVVTNAPLQQMSDVAVMDLIFRSGADYPRHFKDFLAEQGVDRWISFTKGRGFFVARFRIEKRHAFSVPGAERGEAVFYEIEREAEGSWADERGNSVPPPMEISHALAFVVDAGERKYVFRSAAVPNDETLKELEQAISTFRETAEPAPGLVP